MPSYPPCRQPRLLAVLEPYRPGGNRLFRITPPQPVPPLPPLPPSAIYPSLTSLPSLQDQLAESLFCNTLPSSSSYQTPVELRRDTINTRLSSLLPPAICPIQPSSHHKPRSSSEPDSTHPSRSHLPAIVDPLQQSSIANKHTTHLLRVPTYLRIIDWTDCGGTRSGALFPPTQESPPL
ncbi:unnamed protein product [Cyclocybe aegerita]|uniref:Uncharacterized protein n=1 Tax=Cyclocybe aegerita TaxID=1973307 RepID=A0A8S0XDM8_CYCAE|nr:unnamed protein product [Cyclocybe aegerita]